MGEGTAVVDEAAPAVSIIVPCYNGNGTLARCLRALRAQVGVPAFEIIVADDASTDGSGELATRLADRVVEAEQRGGAGRARNRGASVARGRILAFTDADCVPPPSWLARLLTALEDPEVAAVGGGYSEAIEPSVVGRFNFLELQWRRRLWSGGRASCLSNNLALPREQFFAAGGFPVHMRYGSAEDLVLTYRVSRRGRVEWLADNGVGHHFHARLRCYLAQQYRFARPMPYLYLRTPGMITADTHHHKGGFLLSCRCPRWCARLWALVWARPSPWCSGASDWWSASQRSCPSSASWDAGAPSSPRSGWA